MARKANTNSVESMVNDVENQFEQLVDNVTEENMNVVNVNMMVEEEVKTEEPLTNDTEIAVISLVDNVSYKDNRTGDYYQWDKADHVEYMTVETLNNLWRNHKRYFRSMWLKPNDERIIKRFGLESMYKKFNYLMDAKNYTRVNIKQITDGIDGVPNEMKRTICDKVKGMVANGTVTDVSVIRALEKKLGLDLISILE